MTNSEYTQAVIDFLLDCPNIEKLFFNFAAEEDGSNQFVKEDSGTLKNYIDGGKLKYYTFSIISYVAVSHNPIVDETGFADENMENLALIQEILDWVNTQGENLVFPDFGSDVVIDEMKATTDDPNLNGVDTSQNPPLAQYSFTIRIQYLDTSKAIK